MNCFCALYLRRNSKGIAEDEIYSFAKALRERCSTVVTKHSNCVDIVGTGGSRTKTFNVSTAAAFVVAGTGIPVAKHGNRAATSSSGSADVLTCLGIDTTMGPDRTGHCLDEIGICFMYAPNFHRLSASLATVRRGLGYPTIFNCVGPLCNPAGTNTQVIGVWSGNMLPKIAGALRRLGTSRSLVVHGESGLDEISADGRTFVARVGGGTIERSEIFPADFGFRPGKISECRTHSPIESAQLIRSVLSNELRDSTAETLVLLNAAAAIQLFDRAASLLDAADRARESLRSGAGANKLEQLAAAACV